MVVKFHFMCTLTHNSTCVCIDRLKYGWAVAYQKLEIIEKFKSLALKVVAVAKERFQLQWFEWKKFGILEKRSLTKGSWPCMEVELSLSQNSKGLERVWKARERPEKRDSRSYALFLLKKQHWFTYKVYWAGDLCSSPAFLNHFIPSP